MNIEDVEPEDNDEGLNEILLRQLSVNHGIDKTKARYEDYLSWIKDFVSFEGDNIDFSKTKIVKGLSYEKISMLMNIEYWRAVDWIKEYLGQSKFYKAENSDKLINHYKIIAITEYIIMKILPFRDNEDNPLLDLNASFALYVAFDILYSWNEESKEFNPEKINSLLQNDSNTQIFLKDHLTWLKYHCRIQTSIFSNMQTIRLFHFWLISDSKKQG